MTIQEAIKILRNAAWLGSDADRDRTEEAIEVALEALETKTWYLAEPTAQEIDRIQNAINHIKTSLDVDPWAAEIAVEAMQEKMEHLRDGTKKTGDLIDRAKAQTAIMLEAKRYVISAEAQAEGHVLWSAETIDLESALDALRRVPSAQQKLGNGGWKCYLGKCVCMTCGAEFDESFPYCPMCGTFNGGEHDG